MIQVGGAIYDSDLIECLRQIAYDAGIFINESILEGWPDAVRVNLGADGLVTYDINARLPTLAEIIVYMIGKQNTINFISNKLYEDLTKHFQDYIGQDMTLNKLMILLNPIICEPAGCRIVDIHPIRELSALGYSRAGTREFISPAAEDDANKKVSLWGLIVLAYLNELFEGRSQAKSILGGILGYPPIASINSFDLSIQHQWEALAGNLDALFVGVVRGKMPAEVVNLVAGGARKTRRKRNKNHNKSRKTRRQ